MLNRQQAPEFKTINKIVIQSQFQVLPWYQCVSTRSFSHIFHTLLRYIATQVGFLSKLVSEVFKNTVFGILCRI